MVITKVKGRSIYDSRGKPTVEVDVMTNKGLFRASVATGVSASAINESIELRDGGYPFGGKGVRTALRHVNEFIGPELINENPDVRNQKYIDQFLIDLDGTEDKSKCGVNAIAPVSMAVCRAGAAERSIPLYRHIFSMVGNNNYVIPVPAFNMIDGGIYAGNDLPFQEYIVLPTGAENFAEAMRMGTEIYHYLQSLLKAKFGSSSIHVGNQGAFSPDISNSEDALQFLMTAINGAGYAGKISLGIDAAASEFAREGKYDLNYKLKSDFLYKSLLTGHELAERYKKLIKKYPVILIEDPFDSDDWENFTQFTASSGIHVLGDDLTVSNCKRVHKALKKMACNGILIKLNQIGTVTEVVQACQMAHRRGMQIMMSHRSGETEDAFISDLAVGVSAVYLKAGAPCRTDRTCKYNQMLRIEDELGELAHYAGNRVLKKPTEL